MNADPANYIDPEGLINREAQRGLDKWFGPKIPPGHCATAECAAGLTPAPSETRSQKEIDKGQCKLVCQISLFVPVAACNIAAQGGRLGMALGTGAKAGICEMVCR
ncbi:hypothetical protein D3C71_1757610 [compost metagenome]